MGSQSNFPSKKEIIMYGLWTIYTKIETQDPAFVFFCNSCFTVFPVFISKPGE
jgi:hypothetical protein